MSEITSIGNPPWNRVAIVSAIDEFLDIYSQRPIRDNHGGMKAPHMFAVWFMAKQLAPDLIVESGVWKGQSTWLLETACPNARLISIDIDLRKRTYVSDKVIYSDRDFCEHDWTEITENSLVFFDDHQNAYTRLQQCNWFGFKNVIFEDNYPPSQGNCYSLKKAFSNAGFGPLKSHKPGRHGFWDKVSRRIGAALGIRHISLTPQYESNQIEPNNIDSQMLKRHLQVYYEFPPVFRSAITRWGDDWNDIDYPTPDPLLSEPRNSSEGIFRDEAQTYTWICYAKLK